MPETEHRKRDTVLTRERSSRILRWWTTLKVSYWLGWQIESNWTDPFLFFVYSIARPLGSALILVFMFFVVAQSRQGPILGFFIVGTAFWPFIVNGMQGMAWSIISDREHWRTLKYVYTSPIPYRAYLIGRALAQATSASAAMLITLLFGRWVLNVPIGLATIHVPYSLLAFVLGIAAVIALGLVIVSAAMMISGEAWRMPEAVGAALYLLCGAVFPVTVLPELLQKIAQVIPLTWWLEAMRRGLLGSGALQSFSWAGDSEVLMFLAVVTAVWLAIGLTIFAAADRRARELGILDRESGF